MTTRSPAPRPSTSPTSSARPSGGRRALLVFCIVAWCTSLGTPASATTAGPAELEAGFVAKINDLRAGKGLGSLTVDAELTAAARDWAGSMAAAGRISHASSLSSGVSSNWSKIGENVGVGPELDSLFQAFVDSPTHYDNLVDPVFTRVGVGVVVVDGTIYTTHRFMALFPDPTPTPAAPAAPAPATPPPTTEPAPTTTTTVPPTTTTTTTTVVPSSTDETPALLEIRLAELAFIDARTATPGSR